MTRRILMVVTSTATLGDTGGATGAWLEELAAPYNRFIDAGHEVRIASIAGGKAPLDPASLEAPWLTPAGQRFLGDAHAMQLLESTPRLQDVDAESIDAVYLVGGAGSAWDFPTDAALARLIESLNRRGGILGGVCHGVLGLTAARGPDGKFLVAGRKVTGVSDAEEKLIGYDTVVPSIPERRMRELGGRYSCAAEPFGAHVVRDGNLITGQNPASAEPLAEAILEALR